MLEAPEHAACRGGCADVGTSAHARLSCVSHSEVGV
jgi:hypothetical protein